MSSEPTVSELKLRLTEEEGLYAELLEKLDDLSRIRAPYDQDDTLPELLLTLNQSLASAEAESLPAAEHGLKAMVRGLARRLMEPELAEIRRGLERQRAFASDLVQFLNRFAETANRAAAAQAEFTSTLVGFAQRIDRLADAKDRLYASLGNTRADLLLEAMDKRLEQIRLGVRQLHERLSGTESSLAVTRAELRGLAGHESASDAPEGRAENRVDFEAAHYLAFEERFRGSSDEIRLRLRSYVSFFERCEPVLDLGCGRGEFLELLKDAGIEASGVDGNQEMVHACRDKGLAVEAGDLVAFLADRASGSVGGVFAAQVIEHLPPSILRNTLGDCHRVLRPEGRVVLETVNPRSVLALVDAFYRDLTHQKPIHPETLDFMLRAAGFRDVAIQYSSPVSERARLLSKPDGDDTVNRNFEKLNALLFGDMDYAAIATK